MAGRGLAALLVALSGCAQTPAPERTLVLPEPSTAGPTSVVVVSIAGLTPARYREPGADTPTIAAMAQAGASADAVRGVAPASSYPAHATLTTGRLPSSHGVVADRRLGDHGVGAARYSDAKSVRVPTLWKEATSAGLRVATLGWPSTVGAEVASNLPDVEPSRAGETWLDAIARSAKPSMTKLAGDAGAASPDAVRPGAARDALLVEIACRLEGTASPPQLLLLHLSQTAVPLRTEGVDAPETRSAFRSADQATARLLACLQDQGRLGSTAFVVVGDHGIMSLHTIIAPNAVLARAGLLTPQDVGTGLVAWSAVARSNEGSAFVYARRREDAVLARRALQQQAEATGAFRVVTAQEMLEAGADPAAWFGLEAEPGYAFADTARGSVLRAAVARGSGGYLPGRPEMDSGFVAWGPGIGSGVRIPTMQLTDVAPTLAPLLGIRLDTTEGRRLVGVLRLPRVAAPGR